ncbi:MAG: glycosyltransferase [Eggerthellaceae bacterium]|jgi:glycosyltransferase involved in cell wall biosynthesis|nr:glycosyltransferase [Eggerthellaceae bacterium]MCH4220668.1 glycosyltransferase [Eggerthellaceae bacterium]
MLKTVSVAMAVCNGEPYLSQQIDSILSQLSAKDELVISYDSSSDHTLNIVMNYAEKDKRITIVKDKRSGVVENFNNALAHCKKDIVFISDQDDIWLPDKRSKIVKVLEDTQADLVIHNAVNVDSRNRPISRPLFEEYSIRAGALRNFIKPRYSGCCMAFPISSLKVIFPMPLSVVNYDHWIGMLCELFGTVVFDDDILLHHRIHDNNLTTARRSIPVILRQRTNLLSELIKRKRMSLR